jgi:hypothetical protein
VSVYIAIGILEGGLSHGFCVRSRECGILF